MLQSYLFQFACQCFLLDDYPEVNENVVKMMKTPDFNLDAFIFLVSNHFVVPALTLKFKRHGILTILPADYATHLLEVLELNRKRNAEILQQIDEINAALQAENIEPVYLKGTANLMDNMYSDIGERMIGDIDFLVQDQHYLKTAEIILQLGYRNDATVYDDLRNLKHYPRLYREDVPADIEIHRVPVNIKFSKQYNTSLVFQYKKAIPNKPSCFVPSNQHKTIHTFIHSQLSNQGFRLKKIPLRDAYDFYLLLKRVNHKQLIQHIEEQKKAEIFTEYIQYLFSPQHKKHHVLSKTTKAFADKHGWLLDHPQHYRRYIHTRKLADLLFKRYLGRIGRAFFQKSSFCYIYVRLKDPAWYKMHLKGIKDSFS